MVSWIVDRIVNVERVCLCPQMDIVALVMRDSSLVVNRTTSWQQLVAVDAATAGQISALCWSPDGRQLAVGHYRGELSIFDVEAGALAYGNTCRSEEIWHKHKISLMWWAKQVSDSAYFSNRSIADSQSGKLTAGYLDRGESILSAPDSLRIAASSASGNIVELEHVSMASQSLTLLVTGDEDGALILSMSGLFPVARLQLKGGAAVAVACCTSGDLRTLHVWVQTVSGPKLETYDMEFLATRQREVIPMISAYMTVATLLERAVEARSTAYKLWREALAPLDRKFAVYDKILRDWHAIQGSPPRAKAELLILVMHGVAGSATAQFLDDNMTEPSLSRTHKLVETMVVAVEKVLNDQLLRPARLVCYRVAELVAYSRLNGAGFRPETVGLDLELCRALLCEAEKLVISAEAAMSELQRARLALSKLFKWFKMLHVTVHTDKSAAPTSNDDAFKYKLNAHDRWEMAALLVATRLEIKGEIPSKTETVLDLIVTKLSSKAKSKRQ